MSTTREAEELWRDAVLRPAIALPILAVTADTLLASGRFVFIGGSFHVAGGAGTLILRDGMDVGGAVVMNIGIGSDGTSTPVIGQPGVRMRAGVFLDIAAFTSVSGAVWVCPVDEHFEDHTMAIPNDWDKAEPYGTRG